MAIALAASRPLDTEPTSFRELSSYGRSRPLQRSHDRVDWLLQQHARQEQTRAVVEQFGLSYDPVSTPDSEVRPLAPMRRLDMQRRHSIIGDTRTTAVVLANSSPLSHLMTRPERSKNLRRNGPNWGHPGITG